MSNEDRVINVYGGFRKDVAEFMVELRSGRVQGTPNDIGRALRDIIYRYPGTDDLRGLTPDPAEIDEDYLCTTECGCYVELDGYCEHGNPSKALEMGMV